MNIYLTKSPEELIAAFYRLEITNDVAKLLEIDFDYLIYYLFKMQPEKKYRIFFIPKKSGGKRKISAPISAIQILQQKLNQILQLIYKPTPFCHGFVINRSIVTNAKVHASDTTNRILNIDLKDFFPSISFRRVRGLFMAKPYSFNNEVATVLANICCFDNQLPQGAPTSPIISNMICFKLDYQLGSLARHNNALFTRYADDITFSTKQRTFSNEIVDENNQFLLSHVLEEIIKSNGFEINFDKVRLGRKAKRLEVTGLTVNQFPNVRRDYIRQIRAMLHAWEKYGYEAAQNDFYEIHDKKARTTWYDQPYFEYVVKGKLEFLRMVRGEEDVIYQKLKRKFSTLAEMNGSKNRKKSSKPVHSQNANSSSAIADEILINDQVLTERELTNGYDLPFTPKSDYSVPPPEEPTEDPGKTFPAEIKLHLSYVNENSYHVIMERTQNNDSVDLYPDLPYNELQLKIILKILRISSMSEIKLSEEEEMVLTDLGYIFEGTIVTNIHQEVGKKIYTSLFRDDIQRIFQNSLSEMRFARKPLSLQLIFSPKNSPTIKNVFLMRYPWELLFKENHIVLNGSVYLKRNIIDPQLIPSTKLTKPIKILFIESRPSNLSNLPANTEYNVLNNAFQKLISQGLVIVEKLTPPSFQEFTRRVLSSQYDVIHFDGHGEYARVCPTCSKFTYPQYKLCQYSECGAPLGTMAATGILAFEKDEGTQTVEWVTAEKISTILNCSNIKFAVLSACRSGQIGEDSAYSAVGTSLIQIGIPIVIAMQLPIKVTSASIFLETFYETVAKSNNILDAIPEAVKNGRLRLYSNSDKEWFVPALLWKAR